MTPDDVATIREHIGAGFLFPKDALALCDALEAAWAQRERAETAEAKVVEWREAAFAVDVQLRHAQTERDTLNVDAKAWLDNCRKERERAERAEALCDAVVQTYETRLARVRELVDEADGEPKRLFWPSEILAAIEGDSQ